MPVLYHVVCDRIQDTYDRIQFDILLLAFTIKFEVWSVDTDVIES